MTASRDAASTRVVGKVLRHRRIVVLVWAVAVAVSLPLAAQLSDELSGAGYEVPGSDSERARQVVEQHVLGAGAQELFVVVPRTAGDVRRRAARAASLIRDAPGVRAVGDVRVSPRGRTALVPFVVGGGFDAAQRRLEPLRDRLEPMPGVEITGQAAVYEASDEIAAEDLAAAERVSLPITLAILLVAFLSLIAAALPIALAIVSLTVTFAALLGVTQVLETSVFVTNSAIVLGLALSIDYALFVVTRYREERQRRDDGEAALAAALATAGRAVLFSGLTVSISLASLLVVGVDLFTSMAIGAALASIVAALAALTLLPALLAMLGPRVDRFALRRASHAAGRAGVWRRVADVVLRHRVVAALGSTLLLVAACVPLLDFDISYPSTTTRVPSQSHPVAAATQRVERDFGSGVLSPFEVVTRADPQRVSAAVAADPGVRGLLPPARGEDGWVRITAIGAHEDSTAASRATLQRLRESLGSRFAGTFVGGHTAEGADLTDRISDRAPLVVLTAAVLTFLLLFAAFRSLVVPLKAIATNLLVVGASLGLLTVIFQWVGGAEAISFFVPLFLFAVLFGLSMDYEVFLLSRIREEHLAGASNDESIRRGLIRSGRAITLAAVVMTTVFAASAVSALPPVQQFGVGMSLAVLIDATLARCVLVPATMALLGARNWWAPRPRAMLAGFAARRPRSEEGG